MMMVIAHRGSSGQAPENTLAALRTAWQEGADGVEFDLRATRDGCVVVIHDANVLRTTGADAAVGTLTRDEILSLDAGAWKGDAWRGERIPTLLEWVAAVPVGRKMFVEIKDGPELIPLLKPILAGRLRDTHFVGFSLDTMRQAKAAFPECDVYWNVEYSGNIGGLLADASQAGLDGLGIGDGPAVDASVIDAVHAAGMRVFAWTIDDVARARQYRTWGTEFLASNCPGRISESLKRGAT